MATAGAWRTRHKPRCIIDADSYFRAFVAAARHAKRSLLIAGWDLHSRTRLLPAEGPAQEALYLGDFLNALVRARRRLHIHILIWDFPMIYGLDREWPALYGAGWDAHRRVHLRYDDTMILLGLTLLWRYTPLVQWLAPEQVTNWAQRAGSSPALVLAVLLAYTPASLIMFPRPLITLFAVVAFGPLLGFTYALSGVLLAASVTYVAGRRLDRSVVRRIAGERLHRMSDLLRRRGLLAPLSVQRHDLSYSRFEPRGAIELTLDTTPQRVCVIAAHLGLRRAERQFQWHRLITVLNAGNPELPVILLGDMNEWFPHARILKRMHALLGEPPAPVAFPSFTPVFALTRVWVRPRHALLTTHVHRSDTARRASDHLPVKVDIDFSLAERGRN